ncbi:MAG: ABC transporter permease [Lachnospiraceae bacterium]|nr:ABC transporter permease [Lachnospiraceae bacterium]
MKRIGNPLRKRILREFIHEIGKYIAIFLFMTLTVGFVSGFLVASGSMKHTYDESFERYNVEHGHFVLKNEAGSDFIEEIEKRDKITAYKDFYLEEEADINGDGAKDGTFHIFGERKEINKVCLMEGDIPEKSDEIALDRLYMNNNELKIGDKVKVGNRDMKICGIVALSDYSALYQDNNDIMFDANLFSVAVVSKEGFISFGDKHKYYNYAWLYDKKPKTEVKEKEAAEDFSGHLAKAVYMEENQLELFLPGFLNQAIHFSGDDIGKDRPMMTVLLYVLIVIMGFVFAVTINNMVLKEAAVIGTLRASGYKKGEIFRHYITIPVLVTLVSAILGNLLGYTIFESVARDMYLRSYSFTTYETLWNGEAFVMTTVVPVLIIALVVSITLGRKLSMSPLRFLRRDIEKRKKKKVLRLSGKIGFMNRFRIRIIQQNLSGYLTLFIGIVFSCLILMFGMIMPELIDEYSKDALKYKPAEYQYTIYEPYETDAKNVEKYCISSLKMQDDYYDEEDISIYGIKKNSEYFDVKLPKEGVTITSDLANKYKLKKGDIVNLKEEYGNKLYAFRVSNIMEYPTCLGIFFSMKDFREVFDMEEGYFNGYFSNQELTEEELPEELVAGCVVEEDLTKLARQMDDSMGAMFNLVQGFALVMFLLLMYLLTKQILEKNTNSISLVKVLGYKNGEIGKLYIVTSIWVVLFSTVFSMAFNTWLFHIILRIFMKGFGGWFNLVVSTELYLKMSLMIIVAYLIVVFMQFIKIKKIPMEQVLKNVE